jgi:tRNA 2-thiouridine synthesizing protein A
MRPDLTVLFPCYTKKALEELQPGQVLEIITTDPGAKADIPAFCNRTGHELLEVVEEGGKIIFYVRKKIRREYYG